MLVVAVRAAMGLLANQSYEKQFSRLRTDALIPSGLQLGNTLFGAFLIIVMYPLTLYRFTASKPDERITAVPIGSEYYTRSASALEDWFDRTAVAGQGVFDGITAVVRTFLESLELAMVGTPWPVVMVFFFIIAWPVARIFGYQWKTFVPPMMFNNSGNMGLPGLSTPKKAASWVVQRGVGSSSTRT